MKKVLGVVLFALILCNIEAKTYWVFFKDKKGVKFLPEQYFHPNAIQRRLNNGLSLSDTSDFPLNQDYIRAVSAKGSRLIFQSRWFNAVKLKTSESRIQHIKSMPFVDSIWQGEFIARKMKADKGEFATVLRKKLVEEQVHSLEGDRFHENKISGRGIRIAVFDGGFPNVDKHEAFTHLFQRNKIVVTYDFVKKKENVYAHNSHGTSVLSCIAGVYGEQSLGMAQDAEFLLARTEIAREKMCEEEYWLAAAEWADKNGAHIISSSLGYTNPRYTTADMNGKTSLVALAAKLASDKGILVVNAMGNDGDGNWEILGTPADVSEVLSVGGVNPFSRTHISFSSHGPNKLGQTKPNVCALGMVIAAGKRDYKMIAGTSFSTPLITGFAACVWQMHPNWTNKQVFEEVLKSGHLYPYFDYLHGYGIPQASYFFTKERKKDGGSDFPCKVNIENNFANILFKESKRRESLYFHLKDEYGRLIVYGVQSIKKSGDSFKLDLSKYPEAKELNFRYKQVYKSITL